MTINISGFTEDNRQSESYSVAAKYTGWLDFSDCAPIDITVEGVFGFADSNGTFILEQQN